MIRKFFNNEFYHIFNRGIDERKIYVDKNDYLRFIYDLYEFNDKNPASQFSRAYNIEKIQGKNKNVGNTISNISNIEHLEKGDKRDKLVKLHAFALMPNHHHLLVEQIRDNGVSLFIAKLHGGYSRAFNLKYKRKGHLFQGHFKFVHIKDDIHFGFLICYIHANPLDLWKKNWREKQLNDNEIKQALKFLERYRYSSHLDYLGKKNFPSIISKEFLLEFFDGIKGYKEFFIDWLEQYKKNEKYLKDYIL